MRMMVRTRQRQHLRLWSTSSSFGAWIFGIFTTCCWWSCCIRMSIFWMMGTTQYQQPTKQQQPKQQLQMQQVHALRIMTPSSSLPTPTRRCLQQQQHTRPRLCLEKLVRPTWVTLNMASSKSSTAAAATIGNNNNKNNKVIQNVAIVGAGIAGLTVAHGLVNSPNLRHSYYSQSQQQSQIQEQQEQNFHVSLFDARSCLDTTAGAGVQLNGGLVILGKINPIVQQAVIDAGLPQVAVQSRTKSWKQSSTSSSSYDELFQLNLSQAVKNNINNNNNNKSMGMQSLLDDETGQLLWTAIMRGALQHALVDTLPLQSSSLSSSFSSIDEKNNKNNNKNNKNPSSPPPPPPSITLEFGKRVVNIQPMDNKNDNNNNNNKNNTGALLEFADGTKAGPFDLIIGCDGVKSVCKEYIETGTISNNNNNDDKTRRTTTPFSPLQSKRSNAIYSGIRIKYAIQDGTTNNNNMYNRNNNNLGDEQQEEATTATLTQYFGNGAFALDGTYGAGPKVPNVRSAFLIYLDPEYIGPFRRPQKQQQPQEQQEQQQEQGNHNNTNKNNNKDDENPTIMAGMTRPKHFTTTTTTTTNNNENDNDDDENADWTQNAQYPLEQERIIMKQAAQNAGIPLVSIGSTIDSANRIFSLGVYYHNPFTCIGWSKGLFLSSHNNNNNNNNRNDDVTTTVTTPCCCAHIVLVGDAAHALPPFLGQGSNQAIQDAYCLVRKIYEYNTQQQLRNNKNNDDDDHNDDNDDNMIEEFVVPLDSYLKEYETIRWHATFDIFWKASFLGYLETGGTNGWYAKFRDVFFQTMGFLGIAEYVLLNAAIPKV